MQHKIKVYKIYNADDERRIKGFPDIMRSSTDEYKSAVIFDLPVSPELELDRDRIVASPSAVE